MQSDYDAELVKARDLRRARDRYQSRIAELEAERARATGSSVLLDTSGYPPVTVFDVAELAVQRRVIDVLCTIRLRRGVRGSRTFTPETVVFEWAS